MTLPYCHWRRYWRRTDKGDRHGCYSPVVSKEPPLPLITAAGDHDYRKCQSCAVRNHYDTSGHGARRDEISIHEPPPGGIKPRRVWRISLPPACFQGSIIENQGRMLLCYRDGWDVANIAFADLGAGLATPTLSPVERWTVEVKHPKCIDAREDPRVFRFRGRLHVSFNGVVRTKSGLKSEMMVARLSPDAREVEEVWAPAYERAAYMEKNWQFFEYDGQLWCVYTSTPHVILRMDGAFAVEMHRTVTDLPWEWGHIRGGAPPVRVGDEYYHWFHGQVSRDGATIYTGGLYTFDASPPFAVRRFASIPIMTPPPGERAPSQENLTVVFPCGAIQREDSWLISYGHNDLECRLAEYGAGEVEKMLRSVRTATGPVNAPPHGFKPAKPAEPLAKAGRGGRRK